MPSRNPWVQRAFIFLALAAPLLLFQPFADVFPYQPGAAYSDFTISHFSNAVYIQQSIQGSGQIPLWSDQILSGFPFAADPLASLWYPLQWPGLLFEQPLGLNLVVGLHLLLAGLGMYNFLRGRRMAWQAALVGAYAFELAPKLAAHYAAGHVTLLYAVCWTPWLLFAAQKGLEEKSWRFAPGVVLGLMLLADVRWAAPAAVLWAAFSLVDGRQLKVGWKQLLGFLAANTLLGAILSAPLTLPLLEYSQLSTRTLLTPQDNLELSLPPLRLAGLLIPDLHASPEWVFYPGMLGLIFGFWGATLGRFWKENGLWLATLGVSLLVALGSNLPLLSGLAGLPVLNLLRVPSRSLFLIGLCMAILLAWTVDVLLGDLPAHVVKGKPRLPGNVLLPFGLALILLLLAGGVILVTGAPSVNFTWAALASMAALAILFLRLAGKEKGKAWWYACIGLVVLEGGLFANLGLDFRPRAGVLAEQSDAAAWLDAKSGVSPFRIYSPSYSMPQQVAAVHRFGLADGIDPLQLRVYVDFMAQAAGFDSAAYSVTLPPFASADPKSDNQGARLDAALLGLLNVRYVLSEFDLTSTDLHLEAQFGETRIYTNLLSRPRAWVDSGDGTRYEMADVLSWTPDMIEVEGLGPGRLVLSELAYPGWQAELDGNDFPIQSAYGILRSVELTPGEHSVRFVFRPTSVTLGFALAGIGLVFLMVYGRWNKK